MGHCETYFCFVVQITHKMKLKQFPYATFLIFGLFLIFACACKNREEASIFYINSYHKGYPSSDSVQKGIIETLEEIILIFMYPHWVAGVKGLYWAYRDRRRIRADSKNNTAS